MGWRRPNYTALIAARDDWLVAASCSPVAHEWFTTHLLLTATLIRTRRGFYSRAQHSSAHKCEELVRAARSCSDGVDGQRMRGSHDWESSSPPTPFCPIKESLALYHSHLELITLSPFQYHQPVTLISKTHCLFPTLHFEYYTVGLPH